MGGPLSLRALGVCITVSMVYSIVFFIGSWALDGPGTVGRVVLLPDLAWWQQAFWGSILLVGLLGLLLLALFSARIDRALEGRLRHWLQLRLGDRAESEARRWYRIAGATAVASIFLVATGFLGFYGTLALALALALAGALALTGAAAVAAALALL